MKSYRVVPHTSAIALELSGSDWAAFFEAAEEGLLHLYAPEPPPAFRGTRDISLKADGPEGLLVAWLEELIYLIGTLRWIPSVCRVVEATGERLRVRLKGGPLAEGRLEREIKAATFGNLSVRPAPGGGWTATVILDV